MPNDEQIPTFPVAGYSLRSVPALESLILQFDYLSSPMQELEQAHQGRNYILTRVQTVELRDALTLSTRHRQICRPSRGANRGTTRRPDTGS